MTEINQTSSSRIGIGFFGVLTILFIALKLTGVIAWSWWWVLSPIWITILVWLGIPLFAAYIVFIVRRKPK